MTPAVRVPRTLLAGKGLEELVRESIGEVTRLVRRPAAYRSSAHLEEVDAWRPDGSVVAVVLKSHGRVFAPRGTPSVRPDFMIDPTREAFLYERVLQPDRVAAPRLFGVQSDCEAGWSRILLERVDARVLWQCESATWREVASWLGSHHARYGADRTTEFESGLIHMDRTFHRRWFERASEFASPCDPRTLDVFTRLGIVYDQVLDALDEAPQGFVHGEFFPSNILIRRAELNGSRVCAIDWESGGRGPCLLDLAALTAGGWSAGARRDVESAYRDAVGSDGNRVPKDVDFRRSLAAARIQLALVQLGWSRGWLPPAEHRHDWMADIAALVRSEFE